MFALVWQRHAMLIEIAAAGWAELETETQHKPVLERPPVRLQAIPQQAPEREARRRLQLAEVFNHEGFGPFPNAARTRLRAATAAGWLVGGDGCASSSSV